MVAINFQKQFAPNRAPAHAKCARGKTADEAKVRAKIRRTAERHFGAKKPKSRPIPGSRASGWKHKANGQWERRT